MKNSLFLFPAILFILMGSACTITPPPSQFINVVTSTNQKIESNTDSANTSTIPTIAEVKADLFAVTSVVDGDTIKVSINGKTETIRLIGIDTPETVDPRKEVQCYGVEASNKAKQLLSGKKVVLEADGTQGERDKYDRLLRYVYLEDGTFFNKEMIEQGYANEYTYDSNPYKYQKEFIAAENRARESGKGLWNVNTCNGDTTQAADKTENVTPSPAIQTPNTQAPTTETPKEDTPDTTPTETDTTPPVVETPTSNPQVKKSTSDICHEIGLTYYNRTTNYTAYSSIEDCLASGGRLPKN